MKGCILSIIIFFAISFGIAYLISIPIKEAVRKNETITLQQTELGNIKKVTLERYKGYFKVNYTIDLPSGEKYADDSEQIGFQEGDNVKVTWSKRENGKIYIDNIQRN